MSKLSVYSDPKKLSVFIHRFWSAITLLENRNEVISFLKDLLTPTEIRMFAKRLQIADMLAKGYNYQEIKTYTRVTTQTIATVSNKLNYGEDGIVKILLRLEKIERQKQNRLEGKRNLLEQPGISRAVINLAALEITKLVRRKSKRDSVKSSN